MNVEMFVTITFIQYNLQSDEPDSEDGPLAMDVSMLFLKSIKKYSAGLFVIINIIFHSITGYYWEWRIF